MSVTDFRDEAVSFRSNIVKRFGKVKVLDGVSFSVLKGATHGVIGENGTGESTLMNILYGYYQADLGDIF